MKLIYFSLILALLLSSTAYAQTEQTEAPPCETSPYMAASSTADEDPITLKINHLLSITLPANPSTGFSWEIIEMPNFLEQIGQEEYLHDPFRPGLVGAAGSNSWKFQAIAPGSGLLRFVYQRPWERNANPAGTVTYNINVAP